MEHPISGVVIAVQYFGMQKRLARSRGVHLLRLFTTSAAKEVE